MSSAAITPRFAYAHGPSLPPKAESKYPCQDNQEASEFVTNPQPMIVPNKTKLILDLKAKIGILLRQ